MTSEKILTGLRRICSSVTLLACLTAVAALAASNPIPLISQLAPLTVAPGASAFSLVVNGTGFVSGAVVNWNGGGLTTQFISGSQLSASVPAQDLMEPGTASVTVANPGGGTSNVAYFQVSSPEIALGFSGPEMPSGGQAFTVVAGDFTGDGKLDLVAGSDQGSSFSILLGNGDGTFQSPESYSVGAAEVFYVLAADFNGDGKLDIAAAANGSSSVVSVVLGNGDGTFQPPDNLVISSGEPLTALATGDFNQDGKLDLAIAGESNTVLIALGNGDGTFQTPRGYAVGDDAEWVTVGDFNGDGKLDLAVTNLLDSTVSILLGKGDGTFESQVTYATAPEPGSVVTGDFNGDGKLDLAMVARTTNDTVFAVSILLGNGDGTFQAHQEFTTGDEPAQVVFGDFNSDGKIDLATVNACGDDPNCGRTSSATVSILVGNGDGTFQSHVDFPAGFEPGQLVTGDFNGDGRADLVTAAGSLSLLLQTTTAFSSGALLFASQDVGTASTPQAVTLTNTSASALQIAGIVLNGSNPGDYSLTTTCGASLDAGASCTISVTFTPTAGGTRTALVSVTDGALGSPQTIALTGTAVAPAILINPTSLTFSTQLVGRPGTPQFISVSNPGTGPLNFSSIVIAGDFIETNTCGLSIAAGAECTFIVHFVPSQGGVRTGTITFTDNAPNSPQVVTLTGTGTYFELSTNRINFGSVPVGHSTAPRTVTVTNTAGTAQVVGGISLGGPSPGEFAQGNNCGSSLGAGASCSVRVAFKPTVKGLASATLEVTGGGGVETVALTGTGT